MSGKRAAKPKLYSNFAVIDKDIKEDNEDRNSHRNGQGVRTNAVAS